MPGRLALESTRTPVPDPASRIIWARSASFRYQAGSWIKPRRVVAKVEWHLGGLYPRVGFIVTNMTRPAVRLVMFYNQRGTAEQWIPLCQRSCRPDRIKTSGGAGRRTWLGMDRRLRTTR